MSQSDTQRMLDLLARWQAFSQLQQRAFAFLAAEAIATGQEFETSTNGATAVLTSIGDSAGEDPRVLQAETWKVVHKLQAADRSRQGLEQVASVLSTLTRQHAELAADTTALGLSLPNIDPFTDVAVTALSECVSLADWRRRLVDALHGREPEHRDDSTDGDDELF
ncbi:MAG: hypothetical protein ACM31L_04145 [Actinomycetota bacterium]